MEGLIIILGGVAVCSLVFALDDEDQSWSEMGEGVINS